MPVECRAHKQWMLLHNVAPVGNIDGMFADISVTVANLILSKSGYIVSIGVGETSNNYNCVCTKTIILAILH